MPFLEPIAFDLASVQVAKMPQMYCNDAGFKVVVQNVQKSCQNWNINIPKNYTENSKMFNSKRRAQSLQLFDCI